MAQRGELPGLLRVGRVPRVWVRHLDAWIDRQAAQWSFDGPAFRERSEDPIDERLARAAWAEHRDEQIEGHAPYTCWAAREYEGAPGDISPYEHLKGLRPKPRGSSSQSHGRNDGTRGDYD